MAELAWVETGTAYFAARLDDADLDAPSLLPGWRRRHVVAHVACNARALSRLASWARTGEEQPMYASREARDLEIEETSRLAAAELVALSEQTARDLHADLSALSDLQWNAKVRTAQGRTVPASEVPWMRAREVWIHAVDLGAGGTFADFPPGLVDALLTDVTSLWEGRDQGPALLLTPSDRSATWRVHPDTGEEAALVRGTAAELAAWLTGRAPAPDPAAPAIGTWL